MDKYDPRVVRRLPEAERNKIMSEAAELVAADYERMKPMDTDRMMKWFAYEHLPEHLQAVSKPFGQLAAQIEQTVEPGPERTVAFRKLLEAKDAAVRAALTPGG